ncbi:RHS repeat-associated core domain-containing protein [Catenovulum sp. 2E275]|uniref:RHS repeat domain-containing protein n=1 Tax=Catenovulum sp. 2E275 TaxID=2980497 RepID=UPI0021D156FB|nr:RHS repeat-associated core domain-containing protein [Catenovulum sp. 2E275]MCU4676864.1 RHS repeat-associated core domain-containing protein [Catenovulum sp. 2E275]
MHKDYQGSVEAVSYDGSSSPVITDAMSFGIFGTRESKDWLFDLQAGDTELNTLLNNTSNHVRKNLGYTGHVQLDRSGFIHMQGRLYDPVLGRFLSPDPVVYNVYDSQSWNKYSYVQNSPTKYTDPTGYSPKLDVATSDLPTFCEEGDNANRPECKKKNEAENESFECTRDTDLHCEGVYEIEDTNPCADINSTRCYLTLSGMSTERTPNKNQVTEQWAIKELANMDKWLKRNYSNFPDTKNILIRLNSPVDIAIPPNLNILELNVSKSIFQDLAFHEKLHVYIFQEIGAFNYLRASNTNEIHIWIENTAAQLGSHYRGTTLVGAELPDLGAYPSAKFD